MRIKSYVMIILLLAASSYGGESKQGSFWSALSDKLEKAPRKRPLITTAVGGVRGTKNEAADLYWKGKQRAELEQEEAEAFRAALSSAASGDKEEALKGFEHFIVQYPNSLFREEAATAVAELKRGRK